MAGPKSLSVAKAVDKAAAYLSKAQRADGGFDSYSSPSAGRFEKVFTYQTTFTPAVILTALSGLRTPRAERLKKRLAGFVKDQAGPRWSFNYWAAASPERAKTPYPDDLDDTCCALIGLWLYDETLVGAEVLAALVKLLMAAETKVGGPYRTWLVPADSPAVWHDVDLAVNANIACLLSLVGSPLPNVTDYIERAIGSERLTSPYYVSTYPLIYYLARAYDGPLSKKLLALARQTRSQDHKPTPLKSALLLSALLRLGATDTAALAESLLAGQATDGSWPAEAFCLDPARDGLTYYSGSASLTTALAIEALELYRQESEPAENADISPIAGRQAGQEHAAFRTEVLSAGRRDCRNLEPALASATLGIMERLASGSTGSEIVALPPVFNQSLAKPLDKAAEPLLRRLGLANLYGWAAYTIVDDFLDEEGQGGLLPSATLALRRSVNGFTDALPQDSAFRQLVGQTFDAIDGANAWELSHCRGRVRGRKLTISALPDYGDLMKLAERSLGHGLTPLAVLRAAGFSPDGALFEGVRQALKHYLIARQLNDDLHDWPDDLSNGHLTYVVSRILSEGGVGPGSHVLPELLPLAQRQFWQATLPRLCQTIRQQTALSRRCLRNLQGLRPDNVITGLLDKIDASAAETLAAQDQARVFLKHYKRGKQAVRV